MSNTFDAFQRSRYNLRLLIYYAIGATALLLGIYIIILLLGATSSLAGVLTAAIALVLTIAYSVNCTATGVTSFATASTGMIVYSGMSTFTEGGMLASAAGFAFVAMAAIVGAQIVKIQLQVPYKKALATLLIEGAVVIGSTWFIASFFTT